MKIKLSYKTLAAHGAYPEIIQTVRDIKEHIGIPEHKVLTLDWSPRAMFNLLNLISPQSVPEYGERVMWILRKKIVPMWDLSNMDFSNRGLRGIFLKELSMRESNFSGSDMTGANLYDSNLFSCNFERTLLSEACLRGSMAMSANFISVYAPMADMRFCHLEGASFDNANLRGARFIRSNLESCDMAGADLREADFTEAIMSGCNLKRALTDGANFERAYYPEGGIPKGWERTKTGHLTKLCVNGANFEGARYPHGPVPKGWRRTETGHLTKA